MYSIECNSSDFGISISLTEISISLTENYFVNFNSQMKLKTKLYDKDDVLRWFRLLVYDTTLKFGLLSIKRECK